MKKYLTIVAAMTQAQAANAGWMSALWTFPSVLLSAMLIAWGAEAAQFLMSQGLALAILAWLQTLPEFAVEAVIAFEASKDPAKIHLVTANFTGSLRLLTGLGWPMIYATATFFNRRKTGKAIDGIVMDPEHCAEVMGLIVPIVYFFWIYLKATLTIVDSAVLFSIYIAYLFVLGRIPPKNEEEIEELEAIPKKILSFSPPVRNLIIFSLFFAGGLILYFVARPFLESMLAVAVSMGVSQFVFVQWVSPFLSEFPEKVSAFHWARQVRSAPMALMNMVSSNINQFTVLVGMIPIVFSYGLGHVAVIHFDQHQQEEILLTLAQALVGFIFLMNMNFSWVEALGLFVLWFIQFVIPSLRVQITYVYFAWFGVELVRSLFAERRFLAFSEFVRLFRSHVIKS